MPQPRITASPGPPQEFQTAVLTIAGFTGGLDTRPSAKHLLLEANQFLRSSPAATPNMQNWRFNGTRTEKSIGSERFGDVLANTPLRIVAFVDGAGASHLILLHKTLAKVFNFTTSVWDALGPAAPFTGADTDSFDIAFAASDAAPGTLDPTRNLVAVANGIDKIHVWDGDTAQVFTPITAAPIARFCEFFGSRLISGYTTESGQTYSERLRWPVNGDLTDWTGIGSGAVDLPGVPGELRGLKLLGRNLVVYKTGGILTGILTGDFNSPFAFPPVPGPGVGLLAPLSLTELPTGGHIFLGSDFNIYRYDGNTIPTTVGDAIQKDVEVQINRGALRNVFAIVYPNRTEYHLWIPTSEDTFCNTNYIFNWVTGRWSREALPAGQFMSAGTAASVTGVVTYGGLVGAYSAQVGTYDDLSSGTPREVIIAGRSDLYTHKALETVHTIRIIEPQAVSVQHSPTTYSVGTPWGSPEKLVDGVDGTWAQTAVATDEILVGLFKFLDAEFPADAVLTGIEVAVEGHGLGGTAADRRLTITLYEDIQTSTVLNGTATKNADLSQAGLGGADTIVTKGDATDNWSGGSVPITDITDGVGIFGIGLTKASGTSVIQVDNVQVRIFYTTATQSGTVPLRSIIDSPDIDFGEAERMKTLRRLTLTYVDLATAPTNVLFSISVDGGETFGNQITVATFGVGDSKIRRLHADFFITAPMFRARIEHNEGAAFQFVELSFHASLGGPAFV